MASVDPFCAGDVGTSFASSYEGGGGTLSTAGLTVGAASIRCLSDII